jgi:adenosylcobinamide kinase / adenosylcobinamide-phosphate guanylyltransferase
VQETTSFLTTLIIGGARSGKSLFAEELCLRSPFELIYIATSPRFDDDREMAARIAAHRQRRGSRWTVLEEQTDVAPLIKAHDAPEKAILIDCMTLWLNNLIFHGKDLETHIGAFEASLQATRARVILISNEVGQGIVPNEAATRHFRDEQGRLNQRLAQCCDRVVEVRAGLPLILKPYAPQSILL